jgi:hypothetical protein
MNLPDICVVDTNVPISANKALVEESDVPDELKQACVDAIVHVMNTGALVIDYQGEILTEYKRHLNSSGQPGVGDAFLKWVYTCQLRSTGHLVNISPDGESYLEFPSHKGLVKFDRNDRKFVAVSNAHSKKPPILQATDSKWIAWESALKEVGIRVFFLHRGYVDEKYKRKMGTTGKNGRKNESN